MARSEATRPSIWNFSDGLPRPLRRPRNDKQLSSLAGARSVLLASRMAIQLDCFGALRLAMTVSGYTIVTSALALAYSLARGGKTLRRRFTFQTGNWQRWRLDPGDFAISVHLVVRDESFVRLVHER